MDALSSVRRYIDTNLYQISVEMIDVLKTKTRKDSKDKKIIIHPFPKFKQDRRGKREKGKGIPPGNSEFSSDATNRGRGLFWTFFLPLQLQLVFQVNIVGQTMECTPPALLF